jgi:hypothetical protein
MTTGRIKGTEPGRLTGPEQFANSLPLRIFGSPCRESQTIFWPLSLVSVMRHRVKLSDSLSGLASIIIPSCNPLELTRQCIAALMRYTQAAVGADRRQ